MKIVLSDSDLPPSGANITAAVEILRQYHSMAMLIHINPSRCWAPRTVLRKVDDTVSTVSPVGPVSVCRRSEADGILQGPIEPTRAGTIKVHLHNVYDKLAIRNRTMLALLALHGGGGVTVNRLANFDLGLECPPGAGQDNGAGLTLGRAW